MKKTTLLFIVLGLMAIPALLSADNETADSRIVGLSGDYPMGPVKSLRPPVTVTQGAGQLETTFSTRLGSVNIAVQDADGTVVYQTTVNTLVTRNVVINTTAWPAGDYLIIITFSTGQQLTGAFDLQ